MTLPDISLLYIPTLITTVFSLSCSTFNNLEMICLINSILLLFCVRNINSQSVECHEAYFCKDTPLVSFNASIECYGFYSCTGAKLVRYVYNISHILKPNRAKTIPTNQSQIFYILFIFFFFQFNKRYHFLSRFIFVLSIHQHITS